MQRKESEPDHFWLAIESESPCSYCCRAEKDVVCMCRDVHVRAKTRGGIFPVSRCLRVFVGGARQHDARRTPVPRHTPCNVPCCFDSQILQKFIRARDFQPRPAAVLQIPLRPLPLVYRFCENSENVESVLLGGTIRELGRGESSEQRRHVTTRDCHIVFLFDVCSSKKYSRSKSPLLAIFHPKFKTWRDGLRNFKAEKATRPLLPPRVY